MRPPTGLTLIAVGCVLMFAVSIPVPFVSFRVAGFVLAVTGLTGLRVPQATYRWLRRNSESIRETLEQIPEPGDRNRVPLDAILGSQRRGR